MAYARIEVRMVDEDGVITTLTLPVLTTPHADAFNAVDNAWLVNRVLKGQAIQMAADRMMGMCKVELKRRMEADRASLFKCDFGSATIKTVNSYDPNILDAVLELLPAEEYVEAGALVPEHEEKHIVKRKWNVTKLGGFKKRNGDIGDVIEKAKITGRADVEVKPNAK